MNNVMASAENSSLATRPSLLKRLQSGDDSRGWQDFYGLYGPLIRNFARKAGLTEDEAEEVVQETAVSVARHLPGFTYDPKVCAFKTWLLNLAKWRVSDQLRKRRKGPVQFVAEEAAGGWASPGAVTGNLAEDTAQTPVAERVPDPALPEFGAEWDAAYEQHLLERALEAVKARISLKQFQIFDLLVLREWPVRQVAEALDVSAARVYLAKHRVGAALKKEMRKLNKPFPHDAGHRVL
jgi:RNA polymerase sigma-70 factor (ECF subfamily)